MSCLDHDRVKETVVMSRIKAKNFQNAAREPGSSEQEWGVFADAISKDDFLVLDDQEYYGCNENVYE